MNKPFKFKEFTIEQDRCAMKVGTDGVLLGAWASLQHDPKSILDIGTGTGVIDALEIDENAFEQAVENFENSLWNERLFCYHISLTEYAMEVDDKYDLIVSNPPFYNDDFLSNNKARNTARFTSALSFDNLISSASFLLSESGIF